MQSIPLAVLKPNLVNLTNIKDEIACNPYRLRY